MKQIPKDQAIADALRHSTGNRKEIEASKRAECYSCCSAFAAKDISEWKDEWTSSETQNRVQRLSAICPECGKPTVIGDSSGLLENQAYAVLINHFMQERHA